MEEHSRVLTMPEIKLHSGCRGMPVLGLGTVADPPVDSETTKQALLQAIKIGYRHFDTAALYGSEVAVGEAVIEAQKRGLIKSREELFITSKLWCSDAHGECVLPALKKTLANLKMDYIDQYLIHWPVSAKPNPGVYEYPIKKEDFLPLDLKTVWPSMEECQKLGLTKSIGVSNFTIKKLEEVLSIAKIPPAANQVELHPCWQQKKLTEFCKAKGIAVVAFSPLGAAGTYYGTNRVMESEVLKEIARAREKSIAQIALRWEYEQGIVIVAKSFNPDRMKQNLEIFNWELSEDECKKISELPQARAHTGTDYTSEYGPYKTVEEIWDGDV